MKLDMNEISREIERSVSDGFECDKILVNLDQHVPDIQQEERPKVINRFEINARDILHDSVSVEENNDIDGLIHYSVQCDSCGSEPFTADNESYCPFCEKEDKTLMDY